MIEEAIILTYLEWIRLLGRGWIRIDPSRIARYNETEEYNYSDLICELMRKVPDVGASVTDFIFTKLSLAVLDRHRLDSRNLDLGYRLTLESVKGFYSFTNNAFIVHDHDAQERNCSILQLSPQTLTKGWETWSKASTVIAANLRSKAFLLRFGLQFFAANNRLIDISREFELIVEHDRIAKNQDTMFFGWSYVLNIIKLKFLKNGMVMKLPPDANIEANSLRSDHNTDQPFFTRAPKTINSLQDVLKSFPPTDGTPSINEYLAIATLKQYERYLLKHEGSNINHTCFEVDVRFLFSLNPDAAAFLVSEMGARLPEGAIISLKTLPVIHLEPKEPVRPSAVTLQESEPTQNKERCEVGSGSSVSTGELSVPPNPIPPNYVYLGDINGSATAYNENSLGPLLGSKRQELINDSQFLESPTQSVEDALTQTDRDTAEIDDKWGFKEIKRWTSKRKKFLVELIDNGRLSEDHAVKLTEKDVTEIKEWRDMFSNKIQPKPI